MNLSKRRAEGEVKSWIGLGIAMIAPRKMQAAVKGQIPTDAWLTNHFHMANPLCRPLWVIALRMFWGEVEDTLTRVQSIYDYVVKDPKNGAENRLILETPEGRRWLNQTCRYFYAFLRLYAFGSNCPVCKRPVDAIKDAWEKYPQGYYHSRCLGR